MDRRGFLKQAGALGFASAIGLPSTASLTFKSVPLVSGIDRSTNIWWQSQPDYIVVSDDVYAEFKALWRRLG